MKNKLLFIGLPFFIILFYAFSCDDNNGYSLGDFQIRIATVVLEDDDKFSLILDDGNKLLPIISDVRYQPADGQRVFLNYTILSDDDHYGYNHAIKINDIWNILTKKPIQLNAANADSIGNDPIEINEMWIGSDYLNVDFLFNYGGIRPHAVNLVENSLQPSPEDGKIHLEFRHNSYQSHTSQKFNGFVCFNLKQFQVNDADSVNLSIKVQEWDGVKTYDLTYAYDEAAFQNIASISSVPMVSSNDYY